MKRGELRKVIREMGKKDPDKRALENYLQASFALQKQYTGVRMVLEYYMFYQMVSEDSSYLKPGKEVAEELNQYIWQFFEEETGEEQRKQMAEKLLSLREEVIARMSVLTTYVDRLVIYEYALNRVQYRFEEPEGIPDDETFTKELLNAIFGGKDSAVINDNIRFAIGQLPVRMSRTKYYELVKNGISVYKGSDKSALESFLYMFRTNAMLYQDENEERYFTEFREFFQTLADTDFDKITYESYQALMEKIESCTQDLMDISDLYMQLGRLMNELYILCMAVECSEEIKQLEGGQGIRGTLALLLEKESKVWEDAGMSGASLEEKSGYIEKLLAEVEGKQEEWSELLELSEAALEPVMEGKRELLEQYGVKADFMELKKMFFLNSSSVFADLDERMSEEKVTEEFAEQMTEQVLAECKEMFDKQGRLLRRAVMAKTLEKMPLFFRNAQEVADYVVSSLAQCKDEAEKNAAKELLMDMIVLNDEMEEW